MLHGCVPLYLQLASPAAHPFPAASLWQESQSISGLSSASSSADACFGSYLHRSPTSPQSNSCFCNQVSSGHKASLCTEFLALSQVLQRYLLIQLQYHFALEDPRETLHKESRSMQYNGILQFHYLYRPWKESTSRKVDAKEFNVDLIDNKCVMSFKPPSKEI